jgi:hypothetical protein
MQRLVAVVRTSVRRNDVTAYFWRPSRELRGSVLCRNMENVVQLLTETTASFAVQIAARSCLVHISYIRVRPVSYLQRTVAVRRHISCVECDDALRNCSKL